MNGVLKVLASELGTSDRTLRRALGTGAVRGIRTSPYKVDVADAEREYVRRYWPLLSALRAGLRLEHSVECAVMFGSTARGDDDQWSDIDLLVWLRTGADRFAIARRLSNRLGRRVQVTDVADASRNSSLMSAVLRDGRPLVDRMNRWEQFARRRVRIERDARTARAETAEKAAAARRYFQQASS